MMSSNLKFFFIQSRHFSKSAQKVVVKANKPEIEKIVTGLSKKVVQVPSSNPAGDYKVPEYFCFNKMSYYEAEVEMAKYRCGQPSALAENS